MGFVFVILFKFVAWDLLWCLLLCLGFRIRFVVCGVLLFAFGLRVLIYSMC